MKKSPKKNENVSIQKKAFITKLDKINDFYTFDKEIGKGTFGVVKQGIHKLTK